MAGGIGRLVHKSFQITCSFSDAREVTVTQILHSRQGVETWVTSDGRAYFVQLNEVDHAEGSVSDLETAEELNQVNLQYAIPIHDSPLNILVECKDGQHRSTIAGSAAITMERDLHSRL